MALHPDHLEDLRRSGLTDETIAALGIHTARPQDIPRLVGWDPPGVTTALVFPYPGEKGFCRVKVSPPFVDKKGHTVKYIQRPGSAVHLYIPPLAAKVLKNPTAPLAWTEGEKKAAKACQEGITCNALGGLWNWLEDGRPIPILDEIAHVERQETIYADSDIWPRPDLLNAVYAFGKELEARGAKVLVAIIPPGPDGEKQGLDDYLVAMEQQGISASEALAKLRHIPLRHSAFSRAAKWWKEWIKTKDATPRELPAAPSMTDGEREEAVALLRDRVLLTRFLDTIEVLGCVGEEENKVALYLAYMSRKLDNPISLIVKGESGAGKNFLVETVGQFVPPEDILFISSATRKAFFYLPEDLSHKVVVIAERIGSEDADYSIRTFQSEGRISILVPEKEETGRIVTKERVVAGPTAFIETTTRAHLHPENETRTFELFLDESAEQTAAIFKAQNSRHLGRLSTDWDATLRLWRNIQRLLERLPVIIPYVEGIRFPLKPLRVRRDRLRFLAMVEACALLHQHQRERREEADRTYLVASLDDYAIARELAAKMLGPALTGATPKCKTLVNLAAEFKEREFTRAEIEAKTGWDRKTVTKYVKEAVNLGCLEEQPEGRGKPTRYRFIKPITGIGCPLPTVDEVEQVVQPVHTWGKSRWTN